MKTFSTAIKVLPVTMNSWLESALKEMDELIPGENKCKINYDNKGRSFDDNEINYVATHIDSCRLAKLSNQINLDFEVCHSDLTPHWKKHIEGDNTHVLKFKKKDYPELYDVINRSCFLKQVFAFQETPTQFQIMGGVYSDNRILGIHFNGTGDWKNRALIRVYIRITATKAIFVQPDKVQFSIADIRRYKDFFSRVLNDYALKYDKVGEDHMLIPCSQLPENITMRKLSSKEQ